MNGLCTMSTTLLHKVCFNLLHSVSGNFHSNTNSKDYSALDPFLYMNLLQIIA